MMMSISHWGMFKGGINKIDVHSEYAADAYWDYVVIEGIRHGIVRYDEESDLCSLVGSWGNLDDLRDELRDKPLYS